jgi:hypothetical protein
MLGKSDPVKVSDQRALEPSAPPPNPSRPRRLQVLVRNAVPTPQFILKPVSRSLNWRRGLQLAECDPEWHSLTWLLGKGNVGLLLLWLYAAAVTSPPGRCGVVVERPPTMS